MTNIGILIVEDSVPEYERFCGFLNPNDYQVLGAGSVVRALEALSDVPIDVVLTDMHLSASGQAEGLAILEEIKNRYPHVCAIAMSSDPHIDLADRAKRLGAHYFIRKPVASPAELVITINNALSTQRALATSKVRDPLEGLSESLKKRCIDGILIDDGHRKLCQAVASHKEIAVTILGETGSGKEELAKIIHKMRCEREGKIPFVALNCANINGELAASTLFGHKKGAFTGAQSSSVGAVASADGGIFFLRNSSPASRCATPDITSYE